MPLQATSGAASYDAFGGGVAAVPNYIEDVFSNWLYPSISGDNQIVNNIDLSGKGGLVWIKSRDRASNHYLIDTVRGSSVGNTKSLSSNTTTAQTSGPNLDWVQFNNNGFTAKAVVGGGELGTNTYYGNMASWTFRKQQKFYTQGTYTGNGTAGRAIAHDLGSTPGFLIVKSTSTNPSNWLVLHRGDGTTWQQGLLNTTGAMSAAAGVVWGSGGASFVAPTSTTFTVNDCSGTAGTVYSPNTAGETYVYYIFAHNAGGFGLTGTDNVISCGSYYNSGSAPVNVTLGYEPQWILIKKTDSAQNWFLVDTMRGDSLTAQNLLYPNLSDAETVNAGAPGYPAPTATGFTTYLGAEGTFIYIAIRRGPMKVPTSGTSVYYAETVAQTDIQQTSSVPFPTDLVHGFSMNGTNRVYVNQWWDRLRGIGTPSNTFTAGGLVLNSTTTDAETTSNSYLQLKADSQNITRGSGWNNTLYGNFIYHMFRRAPSFFDEVCYTGTGSARTVSHNLGVAPEMMIIKARIAGGYDWMVYQKDLGNTLLLKLNETGTGTNRAAFLNSTTPTASVFTVGTDDLTNVSGGTFVSYLFATCAGVSKCTAFTGTGTLQTINCGFTAGSRFVLIKRTDAAGDWYVWDSSRGLSSSTDPYLLLNSTAAEVTSTNWVDTTATGFQVTAASGNNVNISGASYIAFAVA